MMSLIWDKPNCNHSRHTSEILDSKRCFLVCLSSHLACVCFFSSLRFLTQTLSHIRLLFSPHLHPPLLHCRLHSVYYVALPIPVPSSASPVSDFIDRGICLWCAKSKKLTIYNSRAASVGSWWGGEGVVHEWPNVSVYILDSGREFFAWKRDGEGEFWCMQLIAVCGGSRGWLITPFSECTHLSPAIPQTDSRALEVWASLHLST